MPIATCCRCPYVVLVTAECPRTTADHATTRCALAAAAAAAAVVDVPCYVVLRPQVAAEGRRNKVPLEKGFSQVSWLKLSKSDTDLTGVIV